MFQRVSTHCSPSFRRISRSSERHSSASPRRKSMTGRRLPTFSTYLSTPWKDNVGSVKQFLWRYWGSDDSSSASAGDGAPPSIELATDVSEETSPFVAVDDDS
ncbi:hypothetical protein ACHAWF_009580 [Thalassiosira exigua]